MYDIENLEQQWKQYKKKKLLKLFIIILIPIFLIGVVVFFLLLRKNQNMVSNNANKTELYANKKEVKEAIIPKVEEKNNTDSLAIKVPSLDTSVAPSVPRIGQIVFQDSYVKAKIKHTVRKKKKILIEMKDKNDGNIAGDIENRFEYSKEKKDSLFLAKYYYGKKEYKKAEKWALETNKLDNTIEESWLIFAKSQAKQGKRLESLRVLKAFMKQSGSVKAKILIDKIRRGKNF